MTIKQWTGQGGTGGSNVTTANSGGASGDAFDSITLAGAGTLTYGSTAPPLSGYLSARAQDAAGGTDRTRWYHSYTASNQLSVRFAFRLRSDPGGAQVIYQFQDSANAFPIQLQLVTVSGTRHLQLNAGGMVKDWGIITFGSAATDIYWMDITATKGTTTSNGTLKAKLYDNTQTLIGTEYTSTTANTGLNQYTRTVWGGNTGVLLDLDIWAIKGTDVSPGAYVGLPSTANTAPVATIMARPDPFEPGTVTVTGTVTDADGTVASVAVTIVGGPNNPTVSVSTTGLNTASCSVTATFTALESARYLVRLSGTDNVGAASNTSDVYIDTYATTGPVNVYQEISGTGLTAVGAGSRLAAVTDSDDASYAETGTAPSAVQYRVEMCAYRINRPINVIVRNYRNPSGGALITVTPKLYAHDNTTLIETGAPFSMSSSVADTTVSFAGTSLATKASRRDLIVCLELTQ